MKLYDTLTLPIGWKDLESKLCPSLQSINTFLASEKKAITPPKERVFRAFELTPLHQVRVVILGQDPYPTEGMATGLAFGVRSGNEVRGSLKNILRELNADCQMAPPLTDDNCNGTLEGWARQGVLLVNTIFTTKVGERLAHKNCGWEEFSNELLIGISKLRFGIVFILWGKRAAKKRQFIFNRRQHKIIESAHPSPFSAKRFIGSRPFSKANRYLERFGGFGIDWAIID